MKLTLPLWALALFLMPCAQAQLMYAEERVGNEAKPCCRPLGFQVDRSMASERPAPADFSRFAGEASMLPVSSTRMSPGQVSSRPLNMPGLPPFFLLGDDPLSLAWLTERASELLAMGAVGLVVEVADAAALARMRALAPGLTLLPTNGDDSAARLQLRHYPVLITATALRQ
jgi:integrating conjugative element protein (TIGR03765 family)